MKWIKYKFRQEQNGDFGEHDEILLEKAMSYSESNMEIVKSEAYNGEYEIVDDGEPELVAEPTTDDVLNAMLGVM